MIGHVLMDWRVEMKKIILKKAFDSLVEGGHIVIYDWYINDNRQQSAPGLLCNLNMQLISKGFLSTFTE